MAINRQDSRHRIKRSTLTGVVPTVPVSSDFTDGTWLNTDIRAAEFFYNIPDQRLWIGTDTGSIEIPLVGGSANTIAQVLYAGNTLDTGQIIQGIEGTSFINLDDRFYTEHFTTGSTSFIELNDSGATYSSTISNTFDSSDNIFNGSIIINSGFNVQASDGLGMLELDYFGTPGEISLSTDSGNQSESYLYLTPTSSELVGGAGGSISLAGNITFNMPSANKMQIRVGVNGFNIDGRYNASGAESIITFKDNFGSSLTTNNSTKPAILIGSQNSTVSAGVTNSVILGGVGINATYSNSVYVPDLYIQSSKAIKSSNGGQLDLDFSSTANSVVLSNDNGLISKSYLYLLDNTALLAVPNSSIYLDNNTIVLETVSSSSVNINTRIFKAASTANATAATSTLASISMSNDQTLTIQVVLNAYCASPNRNLGITMMASFLKYGGTIYQTGTTSLITKDGFGDGSTGTIDTDGTNVRIRITNGSGITTNWNASYDYLLTT